MKKFEIVGDDLSDGYHTFDELYEHRTLLFLNLCKMMPEKTFVVLEGPEWGIVFLELPTGQISYHIDLNKYSELFSQFQVDNTYKWDGHKAADVLSRLKANASKG